MKDFFKITLATIVGILVTGAVIVGFGIISLIGRWAQGDCIGTESRKSVRSIIRRQYNRQRTGRYYRIYQKGERKRKYQRYLS